MQWIVKYLVVHL